MINFAVIGSHWISDKFIDATRVENLLKLSAVYSRQLTRAQAFANKYSVTTCYDDLAMLAKDSNVQAVYVASPNSLHFEQCMQMLTAGKHVLCEKPLALDASHVTQLFNLAQKQGVILLEGYMTAHLANFHVIREHLTQIGKIRKAHIQFCQYSSRYPAYLAGDNPNTFNPDFGGGSLMDIGYYCVAFAVRLFGQPTHIQAQAQYLASGIDGAGSILLEYDDFSVTIDHSKISNSYLGSEIQGEHGSIVIDHIAQCHRVQLYTPEKQNISASQHSNSMVNEVREFALQIAQQKMNIEMIRHSQMTVALLAKIKQLTGATITATKSPR